MDTPKTFGEWVDRRESTTMFRVADHDEVLLKMVWNAATAACEARHAKDLRVPPDIRESARRLKDRKVYGDDEGGAYLFDADIASVADWVMARAVAARFPE